MADAINMIVDIRKRIENVSVTGDRLFDPGFHLYLDLDNILLVAESTAKSAIVREESRGCHTGDNFPVMDTKWRQIMTKKIKLRIWRGNADSRKLEDVSV